MEAVEFLKEYNRMCDIEGSCVACDYRNELINHIKFIGEFEYETCLMLTMENPEFSVEYVEQWSKEHPKKTRLKDFLEKYPNAVLDEKGYPTEICPYHLGYEHGICAGENCIECWNKPYDE